MKLEHIINKMRKSCIDEFNIHRLKWNNESFHPNKYVTMNLEKQEAIYDDNIDGGGSGYFSFYLNDIMANDWEEYKGEIYKPMF